MTQDSDETLMKSDTAKKEMQQLFIGLCISLGIAIAVYFIAGTVGESIKHGLGDVLQGLTIIAAIIIVGRKYVTFIKNSKGLKKKDPS